MYNVVVRGDKRATLSKNTTIYKGENNADIIHLMMPTMFNGLSVADDCTVMYTFYACDSSCVNGQFAIKKIIDLGQIEDWDKSDEKYIQADIKITKTLTQFEGNIKLCIEILSSNNNIVAKVSPILFSVHSYPNSGEIADEGTLTLLNQWQFDMSHLKEETKGYINKFSDIYSNTVSINSEIQNIYADIETKYDEVKTSESNVNDMKIAVNTVKKSVEDIKDNIDSIYIEAQSIQANVGNIQTTVSNSQTNIYNMKNEVVSAHNEIIQAYTDINSAKNYVAEIQTDITEKADTVSQGVSTVNSIKTQLDNKINDVNNKLDEVKAIGDTINENGKLFDSIKAQVDTNTSDIALKANASEVNSEISSVKANITALDNSKSDIEHTHSADEIGAVSISLKGTANGVAELDENGLVPSSQLPSYVDDVIEGCYSDGKFYKDEAKEIELVGEDGKIYVDLNTNKTYRWTGTIYVVISDSLAIGETSSTAFRGDKGKIAYEHALSKGKAYDIGLYKIESNAEGHITSTEIVTKTDLINLGAADGEKFDKYIVETDNKINQVQVDIEDNSDKITNIQNTVDNHGSDINTLKTDKVDKAVILDVADTDVVIPFVNGKEYRCGEIASLTLEAPAETPSKTAVIEYLITFKSGTTPTIFTPFNGLKFKESDDVSDGVFVAKADYVYMLAVIWNGNSYIAVVRGDSV